ncbi:MAG: hypothetical protein C0615_04685 [Desulfuromonas sp.]|nr:MAG: hypothetical protein C0615_04685 [Desulfuromonas sp.]
MTQDVSLKILLVDSSPFFRTIERQFLAKTPAVVVEAVSGEEGLAMCQSEKPDLIYLAYDLNDMAGVEFCRRCKSGAVGKAVPVIMVCDENSQEQVEASRRGGSDGVLTKPIDRHKFLEMGRHFLPTIREPRRTCLFPIEFRLSDESYPGRCLDISSGGLFIESSEKIPAGKIFEITFTLPNQGSEAVGCKGVVAWHNERPNPMKANYPVGFGVRFVDLSRRDQAVIEQFTKR